MSRTDKDVPYRIREYREGIVQHDHARGECREETRDHAVHDSGWTRWRHHWRHCHKYELVPVPCPGYRPDDDRPTRWSRDPRWCDLARQRYDYAGHGAWDVDKWKARNFHRLILCTTQHTKRVYHADWPCYCDEVPLEPTCEYGIPRDRRWWRGKGAPPHWFTHSVYHEPMRREARDVLRNAARDWNTYGDTDLEPESPQGRGQARWYWW